MVSIIVYLTRDQVAKIEKLTSTTHHRKSKLLRAAMDKLLTGVFEATTDRDDAGRVKTHFLVTEKDLALYRKNAGWTRSALFRAALNKVLEEADARARETSSSLSQ